MGDISGGIKEASSIEILHLIYEIREEIESEEAGQLEL